MLDNLMRQLIYPIAGLGFEIVYYVSYFCNVVNLNLKVTLLCQLCLCVRLLYKFEFPSPPTILTKYVLNSSAIILC